MISADAAAPRGRALDDVELKAMTVRTMTILAATLRRPRSGRERALAVMRRGRLAVVALSVAGGAAAALSGSPTLLGLALVIGVEELLESSAVIRALRDARGCPRMSMSTRVPRVAR
jgi:hypothetical protein